MTTLGQLMDPLADKLLITAALVSLVQMDLAPAWMVAVILGREFAVTVLRSIAHARGVVIPASPLGKFKMASQVIAILLLISGTITCRRSSSSAGSRCGSRSSPPWYPAIDYYRRFNHVLTGRKRFNASQKVRAFRRFAWRSGASKAVASSVLPELG